MEFHPSQKKAVFHERGPAFVLAGPGSGKTRVLTGRIQYLVKERHVPPERILVVTFSRAAAVEMEERFQSLYEGGVGPCFGTFHSAFFRIVSDSAREKLSIMAPERQAGLLADILKQLGREEYLERDFLKGVLRDISRLKTWEIPPEDFMPDVMSKENFQPLYEIYERQKERQGLMDFDDILIRCKKLLTGNPQVLFLWRNRYDYILVDEFQDASRLQYELICLLAAPDYPVFFVGDDDQAIYGFRGAAPQLMSRAAQELPGCRVIRLNINFRSREPIIQGAARLISHNKDRFD